MKPTHTICTAALATAWLFLGCLESNPQPSPAGKQPHDRTDTAGRGTVAGIDAAMEQEQDSRWAGGGFDTHATPDVPSPLADMVEDSAAQETLVPDGLDVADEVDIWTGPPECDEVTLCDEGFFCAPPGLCKCECTPQCDSKECGPDMCLGSCGECPDNAVCFDGLCCVPDCQDKACGDDGCGGSCGECQGFDVCTNNACLPCSPLCDNKQCGDDACGGSCGECEPDTWCQTSHLCKPCQPDCTGKQCGDDGCSGSCGQCGCNESCQMGTCADLCEPQCIGKQCGSGGCGDCNLCGECGDFQICYQDQCVPAPKGPCLRPSDCYDYLPKELWAPGWSPKCKPGTCTCSASKM